MTSAWCASTMSCKDGKLHFNVVTSCTEMVPCTVCDPWTNGAVRQAHLKDEPCSSSPFCFFADAVLSESPLALADVNFA
jgi:hypothetical protein